MGDTKETITVLLCLGTLVTAWAEPGQAVRVEMKDRSVLQGERIEFYRGVLKLFSAGESRPRAIPFRDVAQVVFVPPAATPSHPLTGGTQESAATQPSTSGPVQRPAEEKPAAAAPAAEVKPFWLPPKLVSRFSGEQVAHMESRILDKEPADRGILLRVAWVINHRIAANTLAEGPRTYQAVLQDSHVPSPRDMKARLLLCAALDRMGDRQGLEDQLLSFRRLYPEETSLAHGLDLLRQHGNEWLRHVAKELLRVRDATPE